MGIIESGRREIIERIELVVVLKRDSKARTAAFLHKQIVKHQLIAPSSTTVIKAWNFSIATVIVYYDFDCDCYYIVD